VSQAQIDVTIAILVGMCLGLLFCLVFWKQINRAHVLSRTADWVSRNCNEREIQAYEYLIFTPNQANASDRAAIESMIARAPAGVASVLRRVV
jgi:hypothetical protein